MLGFSEMVAPETCWFKCRLLVFRLLFFCIPCQVDCCHFPPVLILKVFLCLFLYMEEVRAPVEAQGGLYLVCRLGGPVRWQGWGRGQKSFPLYLSHYVNCLRPSVLNTKSCILPTQVSLGGYFKNGSSFSIPPPG